MNSSAWLAALRQHLHLKTVDLEPLLHQASPLQHCRTGVSEGVIRSWRLSKAR